MTQANRFTDKPDTIIQLKTKILEQIGLQYTDYKQLYDAMNERIREVAKQNNVMLIDLAKEVPQTKQYMFDSVHFNDFGSEFVANIIAKQLKPLLSN